jgi:tetratricopeptide (TPR) repeat protein
MTSKILSWSVIILTLVLAVSTVSAQPETNPLQTQEISRERREQALAKLFEAQRHYWKLDQVRSQAALTNAVNLAKQSLLKAIEIDPNLSEAHTLLGEMNWRLGNTEEAVFYSQQAVKLKPDSFGARLVLARIYTEQSRLKTGDLEPLATKKAIAEWQEITRLDAKNAEGWAFLSEYYGRINKIEERIAALKNWLGATPPTEAIFYRRMLGPEEDLKPINASFKLGETLVRVGRYAEAVEVLGRNVVDNPENPLTVDLLRQALQNSEGELSNKTQDILQQAVFANSNNLVLVELFAEHQARLGSTEEAVKTLKTAIAKLGEGDKNLTSNLQVFIGDIYFQANLNAEAITEYETALKNFGIEKTSVVGEEQREFAVRVFEKIIKTYRNDGKSNEVRAVIERARTQFGKTDLFADKQLISFLRESGKKSEALETVQKVRKNFVNDYALLRTEALVLTELGRVDEGVSLIKALIAKKSAVPSPYYDDFSNYLYISGLYTQAKKYTEAMAAAQKAIEAAEGEERKQLATLALATAQYQAGDFKSAETLLRNILKKTPENPIALNNLGYFLLERDENLSEAVELIKKAVSIDHNNSSYLDSLGWGFYKLGKFDEAEHFLKKAVRLNPNSANIYEHLGDVYWKQRKIESAKSNWQKALNFSTDSEFVARIKAKMVKNLPE